MVLVEVPPSLSISFSLGVVAIGMASWLGGGDDTDVEEMDEDDEFAMDDDFGMDDFDDDFGGMGDGDEGGAAGTTELENRIEDLESEIANVSSTANTVRSENEQISEKVDDVEENVRKLLEIYEMVTRGVNPFVDDVSAEAGMGGDGGSFGLFDEEEADATAEADEDLDSDIADAEAEDFFDDDAFDDEFDEEESLDEFDEMDDGEEMAGFDDGEDIDEPEMEESEDMTDEDGESGGGTSFEELKAEYESGDADWADEDLDESDEGGDEEDEFSVEEGEDDASDLFLEDDLEEEAETTAEPETAPETESAADKMPAVEEQAGTAAEQSVPTEDPADGATQDATGGDAEAEGFQFGAAAATPRGDEPYLERPPDGYLADVVILEWLDYLLDAYDARNAVRAINYYERIGWIGEPMRDHCVEMLLGITDAEYVYRDEFGSTDVTMADHRKSLQYVEELAGGGLDRSFADRFDMVEGHGI